jgi:hypothetical protein
MKLMKGEGPPGRMPSLEEPSPTTIAHLKIKTTDTPYL